MRNRFIAVGTLAAVLVAGVAAERSASAQGWGMMAGPGYGMMGPGYGMMGPGYGMMGYGPGPGMMGPGYGPGYGMMGPGYGPGYGPGMMGPGYGRYRNANVSVDDVKTYLERWLALQGNPRLKLGEVKEKDSETIVAEIVTKDNSLVQRFLVDRRSGFFQPNAE